MFRLMRISMEFLRGVLALLGIGCAFMLGRSAAGLRKGWEKKSRFYGWVIRTTVCLVAEAFRHPVDTSDLGVWILAAIAFALGFWHASRKRKTEDLTHTIFPDES